MNNTRTLDQLKTKYYGPLGSPERTRLEAACAALRARIAVTLRATYLGSPSTRP